MPVLSCCTITLGHTRIDGQHISCRSSAGRYLIIHPIARTSRPVISIFCYASRNSCPVRVFRDECHTVVPIPGGRLLRHRSWSHLFAQESANIAPKPAVTSLVHPRASILYPQARSCYCGWKWVSSVASGGTLVGYQKLCNLLGEFCIDILMKNKMFTYVDYLNKHIL